MNIAYAKHTLANGLDVIGVSAPQQMAREAAPAA